MLIHLVTAAHQTEHVWWQCTLCHYGPPQQGGGAQRRPPDCLPVSNVDAYIAFGRRRHCKSWCNNLMLWARLIWAGRNDTACIVTRRAQSGVLLSQGEWAFTVRGILVKCVRFKITFVNWNDERLSNFNLDPNLVCSVEIYHFLHRDHAALSYLLLYHLHSF